VGRGIIKSRYMFLQILAAIILCTVGYQEANAITITYKSQLGVTGVSGSDATHFAAVIGVTVNNGDIYVVDEDNHRVQIFPTSGANKTIGVSGVPGSDDSHFNFPASVAVDSSGNIYVSDTDNNRIVVYDSADNFKGWMGKCTSGSNCDTINQHSIGFTCTAATCLGLGPGSGNNQFNFPAGLAVDSSNNLYVVDSANHRIQIFDSTGTFKSTINVSGLSSFETAGVAVDKSGNIYVTDTNNHQVQVFNSAGVLQFAIGQAGVSGTDSTHFDFPSGVALDSSGNIYVADEHNQRIQVFDPTGNFMTTYGQIGTPGRDTGHFDFPSGVAVDSSNNLYVGDSFNFRVPIFTTSDAPGASVKTHKSDYPSPSQLKPSFGDVSSMAFADGLTIDGKIYSVNNYAVNIPKNIANVGQPIAVKIKQELYYGPQDWQHIAVYMNFEGKEEATYNAHLVLSDDKNDGAKLYDPKGYINDFTATTTQDSQYVYTTFSFKAAKAMADTTMIVSATDQHSRINNVLVNGAIQFGADKPVQSYVQPAWLQVFDTKADLAQAIVSQGYQYTILPSRALGADQIFKGGDYGSTKYFFDTDGAIAMEVFDKNKQVIYESPIILIHKAPAELSSPNKSFSGNHLNYIDTDAINKAKKAEEQRVQTTLVEYGYYSGYLNQDGN
jgi:sugar lactone lactonase YvrE